MNSASMLAEKNELDKLPGPMSGEAGDEKGYIEL